MATKLYVGNLSFNTSEDSLREHFAAIGGVDSVQIITDRDTGAPRGFAFLAMVDQDAASKAIRALDGSTLGGRQLKVSEALERSPRGGGNGGGGGGSAGGRRW
jgi:cold-inducible RNA-binding protein